MLDKSNRFEKWFGHKILVQENGQYAKRESEKEWQPIANVRKNMLREKIAQNIHISDYRLKQYLIEKGFQTDELAKVTLDSTMMMQNVLKSGKRATYEASFALGSIFEGMMELFNHEQHKALATYKDRLLLIENEKGCYIGSIDLEGKVKSVSHIFKNKESALMMLNEFKKSLTVNRNKNLNFEVDYDLQIEKTVGE